MNILSSEFAVIMNSISSRLGNNGFRPFAESDFTRFSNFEQDQQKQIIGRLKMQLDQLELIEPEQQESEKLSRISRYHKLKPVTDEIYARLTHEHLWEIIDFDLNQLYRSPQIFKIGNYTADQYEIYSPWELFDRPSSSLKELMAVTRVLKNSPLIVDMKYIKPYVIEEALAPGKNKYQITHECACPLFDEESGDNMAFISVFKFQKIDKEDTGKIVLFNN